MFWWLLASLASAGTVYIDCDTPVLAKIDGDLVRKDPTTRIIIPDVAATEVEGVQLGAPVDDSTHARAGDI